MTAVPSPGRAALVARLRAAGCVFAEDEARLLLGAAGDPAALAALVERRVGGEPLEHLLGWAEFCGLRVAVGPGVFVPRRRTEVLAREAIALAAARPGEIVVELCCGSGAITAALLDAVPGLEVYAADIDPAAVRYALQNLDRAAGPPSPVFQGDLYDPLPEGLRGRVHVLVANAPYVPTAAIQTMPPEARDHEPRVALDGGVDGLAVLNRVIAGAPGWLDSDGHLLVEASSGQAPYAVEALGEHGLLARVVRVQDVGATVVIGSRVATPGR